tara:strand:+ start:23 stop:541 length:519 start_codon:yes stop_codon:yes gene_type:complete
MAIAVMLIWMYWKRSPIPEKWHRIFQLVGFLILIYLAMIYKGGADGTMSMKIQWWGILGLIGWAYGFNALVFLFSKGRLIFMTSIYIILNLLVLLSHTDLLPKLPASLKYLSTIYSGSIPAFTTAGILTTLLFKKLQSGTLNRIPIVLTGIGILHIIYGILLRPYWGISKSQ